jgi:hypothetical protein
MPEGARRRTFRDPKRDAGVGIESLLLIADEFLPRCGFGPIRAFSYPQSQRREGHGAHHEAEGEHIHGVDLGPEEES